MGNKVIETQRNEDLMAISRAKTGREILTEKVQTALNLSTKKEADFLLNQVIAAVEVTLLENLSTDKFSLKLNSFGKFTVKHRSGILRKIPFTGEIKQTKNKRKVKFITLGKLRLFEVME